MFRSLSPGAIGLKVAGLEEGMKLAAKHGFEGYHFGIDEAAKLGVAKVSDLAESTGVRPSAWGFPLRFRGESSEYEASLAELPRLAAAAAQLGVLRTATWIVPASDELTYEENFKFHAERLKPAAGILSEHGIHLGLEYVGPSTSRRGKKHEFAHTMAQMMDLCRTVGSNVGFLLDAWHWYTAGETEEDLRRLSAEQVVDVHVNDAPDKPVDEQIDNVRALPGETGVIDIATFLKTLKDIGYDGPVMVEPFSDRVRQMSADDACATTGAALNQVWAQAGL
ncbi:sugar phosphate isomerase/epimerase family protein [Candidatus Latescibacterota bacterium]